MNRATSGVPARVAERLADHAALSADDGARAISATSWEASEPYVAEATARLERFAAAEPGVRTACRRLWEDPHSPGAHSGLAAALTTALSARPAECAELGAWLDVVEEHTEMGYHVGPDYTPEAGPVTLDTLRAWRPAGTGPVRPEGRGGGHELLVVVPFRDGDEGHRMRNLLSCLLALRDQSLEPSRYAVTVVEADDRPRWREVITPYVDHYLHAPTAGLFNKSWTMNVGVVNTPGDPGHLCLLDADVLMDHHFLARNLERIATGGHAAHLPYSRGGLLALDEHSSDRALRQRLEQGHPAPATDTLRGQLLLAAPGGSVWANSILYRRIGGFDERFAGWGGEDNDFVERLGAHGSFERFEDTVMHLHHPRPAMRVEGQAFNAHVQSGTWGTKGGYGLIGAYSAV